jgi:nucleoside-diphosphate-sugar epimerase
MKIGITGSTGFIGKNILEEFIKLNIRNINEKKNNENEKYKLVLLLRENSNISQIRDLITKCEEVETRKVDFFNGESIYKNMYDLDIIIHLSGVTKSKEKEDYYRYNFLLTKNIIDQIKNIENNKNKNINFIFFSSQAACGPSSKNRIINENDPENPISNYGKSKLEAERYIKNNIKNYIILRFPSVFGPYDFDGLNLFKMAKFPIFFQIGKEYKFDFIYSKEVVKILKYFTLNFEKNAGNIFHIGYEKPLDSKYFVYKVREILGLKGKVFFFGVPLFIVKIFKLFILFIELFQKKISIINSEKITEIMKGNWIFDKTKFLNCGYKFEYDIDIMIEETVKWYKTYKYL